MDTSEIPAGKLVKACREIAKLSQNGLARKSGVPQTTISQIESGDNRDPSYSTVCALADALGVADDTFGFSRRRDDGHLATPRRRKRAGTARGGRHGAGAAVSDR